MLSVGEEVLLMLEWVLTSLSLGLEAMESFFVLGSVESELLERDRSTVGCCDDSQLELLCWVLLGSWCSLL